jgi:cysteinyl-tRNA synthetase
MGLSLYNTLSKQKEEFKPIEEGKAKVYSCGLTVYNYGHIGNFRTFVFGDLLVRYLKYKGYDVTHVMNITDVEDKTIKNSQAQGMSLKDYTEMYTKAFFEDVETLNIEKADYYPKATEHIDDMINMIEKIMEKSYAYKTEDNSVYFRVKKYKDYGKLSNLDKKQLKEGGSGRVLSDEYDRENISDFALWKGYTDKDGDVYWDSPFGKGRPGWHIECSVMSTKYLGQPFDIHIGGVDLVFPHHENEIAQSEVANGKKFVNYWVHPEHLIFKSSGDSEEKMSKSLGNVLYIRDLLKEGYDGKTIRFSLMSAHYKQQLAYSKERMKEYKSRLQRYKDFIRSLQSVSSEKNKGFDVKSLIGGAFKNFENYMDDNLNISGALSSMDELITNVYKKFDMISKDDANAVLDYLKKIDSVLGILTFEKETLDSDIEKLIKEREEARKQKNFQKADEIRNKLQDMGIILEDTPEGTKWKKS